MKMEIAEELGLMDKVDKLGWEASLQRRQAE